MYKLSGLDASFLYNETMRSPQNIASVQLFELPAGKDVDAFIEELRALFVSRMHLVPYLGNRLQHVPYMTDHPIWVRDGDFDVRRHIYAVDLPAPGGLRELEDTVAEIHEQRYDRARPLWRTVVLRGLEGGRIAYYSGVHHACLDGMAGQAATQILMDTTVEPREVPPAPPESAARGPMNPLQLAFGAWENMAKFGVRQASRALDLLDSQVRLGRRLADPSAGLGAMQDPAPATRLNRSIGARRSYAAGELDAATVRAVGSAAGAKLNDVFLAACGGGIRTYLDTTGELPTASLIAGCPVSLRKAGDRSMSNQVTMMQVSLGTDVVEATARLLEVAASSRTAKAVTADLAGFVDCDPVAWGLPVAQQQMASWLEATRAADIGGMPFNVVVSNVPGPRRTLYSNGARMLTHYPVSIPTHGLGVNITVQSYTDKLYFAITACAESCSDARQLRDDILAAFAELAEQLLPAPQEQAADVDVAPAIAAA